jgi:hypothetical protein
MRRHAHRFKSLSPHRFQTYSQRPRRSALTDNASRIWLLGKVQRAAGKTFQWATRSKEYDGMIFIERTACAQPLST